jgi:hypothetical protein
VPEEALARHIGYKRPQAGREPSDGAFGALEELAPGLSRPFRP